MHVLARRSVLHVQNLVSRVMSESVVLRVQSCVQNGHTVPRHWPRGQCRGAVCSFCTKSSRPMLGCCVSILDTTLYHKHYSCQNTHKYWGWDFWGTHGMWEPLWKWVHILAWNFYLLRKKEKRSAPLKFLFLFWRIPFKFRAIFFLLDLVLNCSILLLLHLTTSKSLLTSSLSIS